MSNLALIRKLSFYLPAKGILEPNSADDPLPYYYHPCVGFLYRGRIKQALSLLTPPYGSILEIGYGSGILLPSLVSFGKTVAGIDITSDPARVAYNLKKVGVSVSLAKGDICGADYPNESFDLVVAISIVEHTRNMEEVINKVFHLLKSGGHFLVGMPRIGSFIEIAFSLIGYHNIKAHHIINYRQFIKASERLFQLIRFAKIPPYVPEFGCLYYNMLFCKRRENILNGDDNKRK